AEAADLEEVLVDVDDVELVLPDADLAQRAQLGARPLEELEGGVQSARRVVVRRKGCAHGRSTFLQLFQRPFMLSIRMRAVSGRMTRGSGSSPLFNCSRTTRPLM